jgi:hypothetical protein
LDFFRSSTLSLVLGIAYLATMGNLIFLFGIYPRRLRERLELDRTGVKLVPPFFMRKLGDPSSVAPIDIGTKEILICRGSQDTRSPYDSRPYRKGFRVLVRSTDGKDRELKVDTGNRLGARQATQLKEGIAASTGLPVQFVQREVVSGSAREIPWAPGDRL